jgi:hypothetical protein
MTAEEYDRLRESAGERPYAGGPLPITLRHTLSLADCYFILAVICDNTRQDAKLISPFGADDGDRPSAGDPQAEERSFWRGQRKEVERLRPADAITLDDCLTRVEADLAAHAPPPAADPKPAQVKRTGGVKPLEQRNDEKSRCRLAAYNRIQAMLAEKKPADVLQALQSDTDFKDMLKPHGIRLDMKLVDAARKHFSRPRPDKTDRSSSVRK